ncbi:MAG: hypothetical protein H0T41_15345 [Rhodobacteraceae bacterium]|nr:hypothetical protein [Paracoccaceae bacterium]
MHLLLGDRDDLVCAGVLARMAARGLTTHIVLAPLAPPARLVWRLDDEGLTSRYAWSGAPQEAKIASVLVRDAGWLDPSGWAPEDHAYMQAEVQATLLAWLEGLPCPVINRCPAALWYRPRMPLLAWRTLIRRCGLPAAETIITNDPAEARDFARRVASGGVVYTPLTGASGYLVAGDSAWHGLAGVQARAPVCLTEPHGAARPACVVGGRVIWDDVPEPDVEALEPGLRRLAQLAGLDFVEVAVAPLRRGTAVVMVDPAPRLEHFRAAARDRILDALVAALLLDPAPVAAEVQP